LKQTIYKKHEIVGLANPKEGYLYVMLKKCYEKIPIFEGVS